MVPALAAAHDRFTNHVGTIRPQHHGGFRLVHDRVKTAAAVRLGSDRIDAAVRPAAASHLHETVIDLYVVKVDRLRPTVLLGHRIYPNVASTVPAKRFHMNPPMRVFRTRRDARLKPK
jgi:hypothetical protein